MSTFSTPSAPYRILTIPSELDHLDQIESLQEKGEQGLTKILEEFGLENIAGVDSRFNHWSKWEERLSINPYGFFQTVQVREDESDYLLRRNRTPGRFKTFLETINAILPPGWENLYHSDVDLSKGPIIDGLQSPVYDHPLNMGVDGNRLAKLLVAPRLRGKALEEADEDRHVETQFFLSTYLLDIMRSSKDEVLLRNAAKLSLYVFVPLLKIYELPEFTAELEDNAFKILDPKGYHASVDLWKEKIGKRYTRTELDLVEESILQMILGGKGTAKGVLKKEHIFVDLRQKSLLSFYLKFMAGRDYIKDALAATIAVDDAIIPTQTDRPSQNVGPDKTVTDGLKNQHDREKTGLWIIANVIHQLSKRPSIDVEFEADGNTFMHPRGYNSDYWVISTLISGLTQSEIPMEVRFTTKFRSEYSKRDHPWYKMIEKTTHKTLLPEGSGITPEDIVLFADIARAQLTRVLSRYGSRVVDDPWLQVLPNKYLFSASAELKRLIQHEFQSRLTLITRRGRKLLHMKPEPSANGKEGGIEGALKTLKRFAEKTNPGIAPLIRGYEIARISIDPTTGSPTRVKFRILNRTGIPMVKVNSGETGGWERYNGPFGLCGYDAVTILTYASNSNGQSRYVEFVTIGDLLSFLAGPTRLSDLNDPGIVRELGIAHRYVPIGGELAAWAKEIREINSVLASDEYSNTIKGQYESRYKAISQEVHLAVKIYNLVHRSAYQNGVRHKYDLSNPQARMEVRSMVQGLSGVSGLVIYGPDSYLAKWLLQKNNMNPEITNLEASVFSGQYPFQNNDEIANWVELARNFAEWSELGLDSSRILLNLTRRIALNSLSLVRHNINDLFFDDLFYEAEIEKLRRLSPRSVTEIYKQRQQQLLLSKFMANDPEDILGLQRILLAKRVIIDATLTVEGLNPFIERNPIMEEIEHLLYLLILGLQEDDLRLERVGNIANQIRLIIELQKAELLIFITNKSFKKRASLQFGRDYGPHSAKIRQAQRVKVNPQTRELSVELEACRSRLLRAWSSEMGSFNIDPSYTSSWFARYHHQIENIVILNNQLQDMTVAIWMG